MTNLIPFESANLPAVASDFFGDLTNDLIVSGGGGFPSLSIKGKVFTLKRGDEKTIITDPGTDDPARYLEVVILRVGPGGGKKAKVYYKDGYTEGSDAKPLCYSNDGVKPGINAREPQCKSCAACPHNVWGSKVSDNGKPTRACSDTLRLAVAPAGQLNDPMLLRVPAGSFEAISTFGKIISKRGYHPWQVVTKIGFDYSVAHQALTFKAVGAFDPSDTAKMAEIREAREAEIVKRITGEIEDEHSQDDFSTGESSEQKPKPEPKVEPKKSVVKPKPQVTEDDDPPPKVKVKVEAEEEAPAPAPKPTAKSVVQEVEDDLDAALDDMDFDD